ncbi:MAG: ABC transporter permease [Tannerellaceae bacterium]
MKRLNKEEAQLTTLAGVIRNEFRTIAGSYSILLVLLGGIFVYGLLYNYMYAPDVVRNAPVVVVDNSDTELSRSYIRLLDATEQVEVVAAGIGYPDAKEMMKTDEAVGILYLPDDFEERVSRGEESIFIMYETTSAFLYYLAMQEASSLTMLALNAQYRPEMLVFLPQADVAALTEAKPIVVAGTALYNYTEGYGSYLIPAVLMVILFQTLLMVIAMVSGGERHSGTIHRYAAGGLSLGWMARVVAAKTFVYVGLYAVFSLFLLGLLPVVFGLPHLADPFDVVLLMIPFLLATCFLGLALSVFFTDAEAPLLMIAFFSVGLIFLSGVSYPLELMPWYWRAAHCVIPAAPATLAFVKLDSMDASLAGIRTEYITLWLQCLVYFPAACLAYRSNIRAAQRREKSSSVV